MMLPSRTTAHTPGDTSFDARFLSDPADLGRVTAIQATRRYSESINSFYEKCDSKKEAEEAARRMLAEKAQFFSAE